MIGGLFSWYLIFVIASVTYDLVTYQKRCDKWAKEHPGCTYIKGYRSAMKKADKQRLRRLKEKGVI